MSESKDPYHPDTTHAPKRRSHQILQYPEKRSDKESAASTPRGVKSSPHARPGSRPQEKPVGTIRPLQPDRLHAPGWHRRRIPDRVPARSLAAQVLDQHRRPSSRHRRRPHRTHPHHLARYRVRSNRKIEIQRFLSGHHRKVLKQAPFRNRIEPVWMVRIGAPLQRCREE